MWIFFNRTYIYSFTELIIILPIFLSKYVSYHFYIIFVMFTFAKKYHEEFHYHFY